MSSIRRLWSVLSPKRKTQLVWTAGLLVVISLVGMASLGLFAALLQFLTNPEGQTSCRISSFDRILSFVVSFGKVPPKRIGAKYWLLVSNLPFLLRDPSGTSPLFEMLSYPPPLCKVAQVYPEDRGTNYAVREGRNVARQIAAPRSA